jgi:hypothetical protein
MPKTDSGLAFVLPRDTPSTWEVQNTLYQRRIQRQKMAEAEQQKKDARSNAMNNYVGQNLDEKDYDGLLHEQLQGLRTKYADFVRKNPGATNADLQLAMSKDLGDLSRWNQLLKAGQAGIDQEVQGLKNTGIDQGKLKKLATQEFLYKQDPQTGAWSLKGPDELDPQKSWVNQAMEKNPDFFVDVDDPNPLGDMKGANKVTEGNVYQYTNAHGGSETRKYRLGYYPQYQKIDAKPGKDPVVVPRLTQAQDPETGEPIKVGDKPLMVADDEAYGNYMHDRERRLKALGKFKQQYGHNADPNSKEDELLLKHIVGTYLPSRATDVDYGGQAIAIKARPDPYAERCPGGGAAAEGSKSVSALDYLFGGL